VKQKNVKFKAIQLWNTLPEMLKSVQKTQYLQEMSKALFTYLLIVSWYELIVRDMPVLQSYLVISLSFLSFLLL